MQHNPNINQIINLTKTFVIGDLITLADIPALIDALQKEFKTVATPKKVIAKKLNVTTVQEYHEKELFRLTRKKKQNSGKV